MARDGVYIEGVNDTIRRLRQFSPDLLKQMNAEIRETLAPFTELAKSYAGRAARSSGRSARGVTYEGRAGLPLSRWNQMPNRPGSRPSYSPAQGRAGSKRWEYDRLRFDTGKVQKGIGVGRGGPVMQGNYTFKGAYSIINRDPAGAVYELMGSGKSNVNMVQNVRGTSGWSRKRLIWRAWDELRGEQSAPAKVVRIIRDYEAKVNAQTSRGAR